MELVLCFVVGLLVAISVYLLLRRHLLRLFFGFILLSNAINLLLFSMGRLQDRAPPLLAEGGRIPPGMSNPLPQALILTSIVISLGLLAFLLVLIYRAEKSLQTMDSDELQLAEGDGQTPEEKA